jgi:hypothetical protein
MYTNLNRVYFVMCHCKDNLSVYTFLQSSEIKFK